MKTRVKIKGEFEETKEVLRVNIDAEFSRGKATEQIVILEKISEFCQQQITDLKKEIEEEE